VTYYYTTDGTNAASDTWQTWTSPVYYYADGTWPAWTTAVDHVATTNDSWQVWTSGTATTTTVNTGTIWNTWITEPDHIVRPVPKARHETRTEVWDLMKAERKRRKEAEKKAEEAIAAQEQAEKKAKDLLEDLIGEDQLKVYEQTGRLMVHGQKYDYLLTKNGDVRRFEKGKVVDLCIHLVDKFNMPDTDNVISLKLLAEANEKGFNKLANIIRSGPAEELPEAACA